MTFKRVVFYIVIIVLLAIIAYSVVHNSPKITPIVSTAPVAPVVTSTATYSCDSGSTITAGFSASSVHIVLSDGRSFDLPQTVSADGVRYASGTTVFFTKGDTAFLQENPSSSSGQATYNNCIINTGGSTVVNGMKSFTDSGNTFTFMYPQTFTLAGSDDGYTQNWKTDSDSTLGLILATVNVPQSFEPNTNFNDAKFTVGTSSDPAAVKTCLTDTTGGPVTTSIVIINGVKYTKIISHDAGAGNRYDTTSYRTVQNNQCYALDYTIHYGELANFGPGVAAFDEPKVQSALEGIVDSFKFLPQS